MINNKIPKKVVVYGATEQCILVKPIIENYGSKIIAIIDDNPNLQSPFPAIPLFHGYNKFIKNFQSSKIGEIGFCIAIGIPNGEIKFQLHKKLIKDGLIPISLIHETAWLNDDIFIGQGVQIFEHVIIGTKVNIGTQCIINAQAAVHHDSVLNDGTVIGPSATICGLVEIGCNSWIGAGSVIHQRIKIGSDVTVGLGAIVINDIQDGITVIGNPARPILKKSNS